VLYFIAQYSLCVIIYTHVVTISVLPNVCHYITEMEVMQEEEDERVLVLVEEGEE